jgi:hypothetical protein
MKRKKRVELNNAERFAAVSMLVGMAKLKELTACDFQFVACRFGNSEKSIRRLWKQAKTPHLGGEINKREISTRQENCGAHMKWDRDEIRIAMKELKFKNRHTI